jgi:transcriptional regulator with XRE-family HTH domain
MLAKNIKIFRKQLKLSQEQLAQKSGLTFSTLAKVESGNNTNPTLETLRKIADVFGVGLDELVGPQEHPKLEMNTKKEVNV